MYGVFFYQMCRLRETSWEWWTGEKRQLLPPDCDQELPGVATKIGNGDVVEEEAKSAARIRRFLQLLDSGKLS